MILLRVLRILNDGSFSPVEIKNEVFSKELVEQRNNAPDGIIHSRIDNMGMFIQELRNCKYIQEKMLGDGISAFNFTMSTFSRVSSAST